MANMPQSLLEHLEKSWPHVRLHLCEDDQGLDVPLALSSPLLYSLHLNISYNPQNPTIPPSGPSFLIPFLKTKTRLAKLLVNLTIYDDNDHSGWRLRLNRESGRGPSTDSGQAQLPPTDELTVTGSWPADSPDYLRDWHFSMQWSKLQRLYLQTYRVKLLHVLKGEVPNLKVLHLGKLMADSRAPPHDLNAVANFIQYTDKLEDLTLLENTLTDYNMAPNLGAALCLTGKALRTLYMIQIKTDLDQVAQILQHCQCLETLVIGANETFHHKNSTLKVEEVSTKDLITRTTLANPFLNSVMW